jgi:hypothetical protein
MALLLIGVGVTDLVFSVRPSRILPEVTGGFAVVVVGLLAGLTELRDVLAMVVLVGITVAWGQTVTRGFARDGRAWVPLAVLGSALTVALVFSGQAGHVSGAAGRWLGQVPFAALSGLRPDRALLLLGVLLVQLSTGNVVVRLVLLATNTSHPAHHGEPLDPDDPQRRLKGGRLLGPMERLFIVGLGLGGHLTAASIVIAAKGLLRWPELSSKEDQQHVHDLTEYFLLGSFVSWLVSLGALVLLAA